MDNSMKIATILMALLLGSATWNNDEVYGLINKLIRFVNSIDWIYVVIPIAIIAIGVAVYNIVENPRWLD